MPPDLQKEFMESMTQWYLGVDRCSDSSVPSVHSGVQLRPLR